MLVKCCTQKIFFAQRLQKIRGNIGHDLYQVYSELNPVHGDNEMYTQLHIHACLCNLSYDGIRNRTYYHKNFLASIAVKLLHNECTQNLLYNYYMC